MSALPYLLPIFRAEDAAGASLPFALLYTYAAGTTTPLATYQDAAGTIPNSNPVVCDANGLAVVYLPTGVAYKFLLTDQYGTVQPKYPQDNLVGGATGATGASGATWRDGAGVPSNAVGADGDYYLNTTNGDVYKRSGGAYAIIANIIGPAGGSKNVINNGTFYAGLTPWVTSGTNPPTYGTGHLATLGAAQVESAQSTSLVVTSTGSIAQSFTIPAPVGTLVLRWNLACYLESVAAANSNLGQIKLYVFDGSAGTETLIATQNFVASSSTPTWTPASFNLAPYLVAAGDYGVRFELQASVDNVGGTAGTKGTIFAIDDVQLVVSSGGTTGPAGPAGPAGPGVGIGVVQTYSLSSTPAGNATGAVVHMGLGTTIKFTPSISTRLHIHFQANVSNSVGGDGVLMGIYYGTGTPPANGIAAPAVGATLVGSSGPSYMRSISNVANDQHTVGLTYIVTGLVVGTTYWFDYGIANVTGGTATLVNPTVAMFEL